MQEARPCELEHFMGVNPGCGSRFDAVDQNGLGPLPPAEGLRDDNGATAWLFGCRLVLTLISR